MLNLTKIVVFLRAAIDDIYKFVYNVKGYLCAVAAVMAVVVVCAELPISSVDSEGRMRRSVALELSSSENENGEEIFVTVSLKEGELCGMFACLEYDKAAVEFVSAELDESPREQDFAFLTNGGEDGIFLVFDGSENLRSGSLVTFVFKPLSESGDALFSLKVSSAFAWAAEAAEELDVTTPSLSLSVCRNEENEEPVLSSVRIESDSGQPVLTLCGSARDCFAVGFDICTVNLSSFRGESYRAMSVISTVGASAGRFEHSVAVPRGESLCVIVKPIAFSGQREFTGKEKIIMIEDGEPIF
jgi:hypothetical protein